MPIKFDPLFTITPRMAQDLMAIEAVKEKIIYLPLTPAVLTSLRETARLYTTHYSTMIEGNKLRFNQIKEVLEQQEHFPGRERDEKEIKGYYAALNQIEQWAAKNQPVTESTPQTIHALVMADGKLKVKPTPYREGQNVIRDGRTKAIVYMPPEAKDVLSLMQAMLQWVQNNKTLPCPLVAGIAHYQFATIHPYYDGNGRTARLLTTLILHLGGYDLKGLYSLEEYYAQNLPAYYQAISIGPSHNYYEGRAEADITLWVQYFIEGMATSFKSVFNQMQEAHSKGETDQTDSLRSLDIKQRKALGLFQSFDKVTSAQIGNLFNFKPRTSSLLCQKWVEAGFLEIVDFSNKGRTYQLANAYKKLIGP
jgi:Fic family protein